MQTLNKAEQPSHGDAKVGGFRDMSPTVQPTKTERRILREEADKRKVWTSLAQSLASQSLKRKSQEAHECACGQRISANKRSCLACVIAPAEELKAA